MNLENAHMLLPQYAFAEHVIIPRKSLLFLERDNYVNCLIAERTTVAVNEAGEAIFNPKPDKP